MYKCDEVNAADVVENVENGVQPVSPRKGFNPAPNRGAAGSVRNPTQKFQIPEMPRRGDEAGR